MKRAWLFLFVLMLINWGFVSSAVLFESDWSTALGNSTAAMRDTNKPIPWTQHGVNGLAEVINADGLDFPTINVLKSQVRLNGQGNAVRKTGLGIYGIGESRFFRVYFRTVQPDRVNSTHDSNTHPHQDGNGISLNNTNWAFNVDVYRPSNVYGTIAGNWQLRFQTLGQPPTWPNTEWRLNNLPKNTTFRIEWQITRLSNTTITIADIRVYNSSDVLLYTSVDFWNTNNSTNLASYDIVARIVNESDLGGFNAGNNGLTAPDAEDILYYQGAICIRDDDWCGAYGEEGGGQNDTTAPIRSSGSPSGLFPFNTTQTVLSLTTNEAATCKYGTTPGTAYGSIANTFSGAGSMSHSATVSSLTFNTTYNYYVRCNDTSNNFNTDDYTITFRISHGPDFTYNWNDWYTNETINFSLYNATYLQNISNVKFVNQYGRIQFLQNLNLSSDLNLAERIKVLDKKIWINSSLIPQFNKSAMLTFTGVGFSNPIIKIDGVDCPDTKCQNVTFNQTTGQYVFNVTGFSVYEIVEQCEDNVKNYDETGKDCGGVCGECKGNSWIWVVVIAVLIGLILWNVKRRKK